LNASSFKIHKFILYIFKQVLSRLVFKSTFFLFIYGQPNTQLLHTLCTAIKARSACEKPRIMC